MVIFEKLQWNTDKTDMADKHGMYLCLSVSSAYSVCYSIKKVFVVMLNFCTIAQRISLPPQYTFSASFVRAGFESTGRLFVLSTEPTRGLYFNHSYAREKTAG
ncbi:MAG: hypothetical protein BGP13_08185 [Sphingobacteriales bacterium 40-81]|nr:MAG: hypothetical protein BGP13_08185 [Sphingobacteriales bacterium 40-81]